MNWSAVDYRKPYLQTKQTAQIVERLPVQFYYYPKATFTKKQPWDNFVFREFAIYYIMKRRNRAVYYLDGTPQEQEISEELAAEIYGQFLPYFNINNT